MNSIRYIILFKIWLINLSVFSQTGNVAIHSPFKGLIWGEDCKLTAGDYNRDGNDDLVVMTPLYRNNRSLLTGCALVWYGSKKGFAGYPDVKIEGSFPGDLVGIKNCASGDFNDDGFDDLVLGNNLVGEPQLDRGYIQFHPGSSNGLKEIPSTVIRGKTSYGSYGSKLGSTDFDGDGKTDLLVEARFDKLLEGRIYIFKGGKTFNVNDPDYSLANPGSESLYLAATGDINRDGYQDVICRSNRNWSTSQTEISLFYGGPENDDRPDVKFSSGIFMPNLVISDQDQAGFFMLSFINLRDNTQGIQIARYSEGTFTLLSHFIHGNVQNTTLPLQDSSLFFVTTPGTPVKLLLYKLGDKGKNLRMIKSISLPGKKVNQFNGMVFLDSDGDRKRELAVAYTDGNSGKLILIPWEP